MADLKEFQVGSTVYNLKDETARNSIAALQAAVGSPLVANTAASMTDTTKIYVYTGSETGFTAGHWYYYSGSAWTDGGVYNSVAVQTDTTLSASGVAADAKSVGDLIADVSEWINGINSAMLTCFRNIAWINANGQNYYDLLASAVANKEILSISAVFTQGEAVIYTTASLDSLREYLAVTINYADGTSVPTTDYLLSGTLMEGTSTITVTYAGKTTTFNVTVTETAFPSEYQKVEWVGKAEGSTGNPYITTPFGETGMAQLNGYVIRMAVAVASQTGQTAGVFVGWSSKAGTYVGSSNGTYITIGTSTTYALPASVVSTDKNDLVLDFSSTGITLSCGEDSVYRDYSTSGDTSQQLKIGTGFVSNNYASWYKIYDTVEVEKDGDLVARFVPCYRKSDDAIGFYDMITETFFTNSGTGAFAKGDDI